MIRAAWFWVEIAPGPLERDEHAAAKADQIEDMHDRPHGPRDEAAEFHAPTTPTARERPIVASIPLSK